LAEPLNSVAMANITRAEVLRSFRIDLFDTST